MLFGLDLTDILMDSVVGMVVGAIFARYMFVKWRNKFMQREQVSFQDPEGTMFCTPYASAAIGFLYHRAERFMEQCPHYGQEALKAECGHGGLLGPDNRYCPPYDDKMKITDDGFVIRLGRILKILGVRIMCYEPKYEDVIRKALKDAGANFGDKRHFGDTSLSSLLILLSSVSLMLSLLFFSNGQ